MSTVRMPIYAQFGVPEVWRWFDNQIQIYRLENGCYSFVGESVCLHGFPIAKALKLLDERHSIDETRLVGKFRKHCYGQ